MARLLVIGDTHVLNGGLPRNCLTNTLTRGDYDYIVHVGDLSNMGVYEELLSLGGKVVIVSGESDRVLRLPDREVLSIGGLRILVIHGHQKVFRTGLRRITNFFNARLVLTGHTHSPSVQDMGSVALVNPGSYTGVGGVESLAIVDVLDGGFIKVSIIGCGWARDYVVGGSIVRASSLLDDESSQAS